MKVLGRVIFIACNILYLIQLIHTQDVSSKVLGESACVYWGPIDIICVNDQYSRIPVSKLPKECSAFIFEGVLMFPNFTVVNGDHDYDNEFIEGHLKAGHKLFPFYLHATVTVNDLEDQPWARILQGDIEKNIQNEINGFNTYFNCHPKFSGLILGEFEYPEDCIIPIPDYSNKVKLYVEKMKNAFPELKIGMFIQAKFIVDFYGTKERPEWLDFTVLDSSFDFFMFGFMKFNKCTLSRRHGGTVPLDGEGKHTLEKFLRYLHQMKIPKDKVYLQFSVSPKRPETDFSTDACLSFEEICTKVEKYERLCADTEETFREKGKFAKLHATGFVAGFIDLDDPYQHCKCDRAYPAFYSILDGWNNVPSNKACSLFNRE